MHRNIDANQYSVIAFFFSSSLSLSYNLFFVSNFYCLDRNIKRNLRFKYFTSNILVYFVWKADWFTERDIYFPDLPLFPVYLSSTMQPATSSNRTVHQLVVRYVIRRTRAVFVGNIRRRNARKNESTISKVIFKITRKTALQIASSTVYSIRRRVKCRDITSRVMSRDRLSGRTDAR